MSSIKKLCLLLLQPATWPVIRMGVAPTVEHDRAGLPAELNVLLDVGGNKGQFASFAAIRWPNAWIYSFEPLAHPRALLERVLHRMAPNRHTIYDFALGAEQAEATIHVASRQDSSSLLPLGDEQKRLFNMREDHTETIQVRRLDDVELGRLGGDVLLKIDVQGFELQVLKGAEKVLKRCRYVFVELSHVRLYDGQALAPEVTAFLKERGYRAFSHANATRDATGRLIQEDVLFVNSAVQSGTWGIRGGLSRQSV